MMNGSRGHPFEQLAERDPLLAPGQGLGPDDQGTVPDLDGHGRAIMEVEGMGQMPRYPDGQTVLPFLDFYIRLSSPEGFRRP